MIYVEGNSRCCANYCCVFVLAEQSRLYGLHAWTSYFDYSCYCFLNKPQAAVSCKTLQKGLYSY